MPESQEKILKKLEERLQVLEDIEAIKKLKVRYAKACDDNYNPEKAGALFSEDAVWDSGGVFGCHRGRNAIKEFLAGVSSKIVFAVHRIVAPDITVEGDKAYGTWYGQTQGILRGGKGFWTNCLYNDEYKKIDGKWYISYVRVHHYFEAPYDGGWARELHMPMTVEEE